jgi:hypothetical protein
MSGQHVEDAELFLLVEFNKTWEKGDELTNQLFCLLV